MAIDLSQFHKIFFDETAEHLQSLESLLLDLDLVEPDEEQLNAIFRAAHSIKGSSSTFGFSDLADVTHVMESLLDRVRKRQLTPTQDLIDTLLAAGDVLKHLLAAAQGQAELNLAEKNAMLAELDALNQGKQHSTAKKTSPATPVSAPLPASLSKPPVAALTWNKHGVDVPSSAGDHRPCSLDERLDNQTCYELSFAETLPAATEESLLLELRTMGEVVVGSVPTIWKIASTATIEQLENTLSFLLRPGQWSLQPGLPPLTGLPSSLEVSSTAAMSMPDDEDAYGFFMPLETILAASRSQAGLGGTDAGQKNQEAMDAENGYGFLNRSVCPGARLLRLYRTCL